MSHLPLLAAANLLPAAIWRIWDYQLLIQVFPLLEANVENTQTGGPMAGAGPAAAFPLALHSSLGPLPMPARGGHETFLHLPGVCFLSPIRQLFRQKHLCLASPQRDISQDTVSEGWSRKQAPREEHDASEINKVLGTKPPWRGDEGNINFSQGLGDSSGFPGTTGLRLH